LGLGWLPTLAPMLLHNACRPPHAAAPPRQVVLRFLDPARRLLVMRVVTRQLALVGSLGQFLRTVNPTAAAAMLARRAVLDAKKAGAFRWG
jgi:hypothetical protein